MSKRCQARSQHNDGKGERTNAALTEYEVGILALVKGSDVLVLEIVQLRQVQKKDDARRE